MTSVGAGVTEIRVRDEAYLSRSQGEVMRVKKVANSEHGPRLVTPAGRARSY